MGSDPVRRDLPSSDGACAVVIGDEQAAEHHAAQKSDRVDSCHRTTHRTLAYSGRDQVSPRPGATPPLRCGGPPESEPDRRDRRRGDLRSVLLVRADVAGNLGFAAEGEGWKLTEAGETAIGGRIPVNPSGGVLSSNPIGASGMIRFAEAAIQVMGKADDHQVQGRSQALGHAYGGGSQYFSMWVVGR